MSARKLRLVLASDARRDIRDVLTYTEQQWGKAQRRDYRRALYEVFDELTWFPELGRLRPEYGSGVRSYRVRQHIVVYRADDAELRIARVLHESRDAAGGLREPSR